MTDNALPEPSFWSKSTCIQLGYGIWVNLTSLTIGLAQGLPAVQLPQLTGPGSNISVSYEEASWIASVLTLFSPIGCVLSGFLMDRLGRSIILLICQVPMGIGWMYTGASMSATHIIIGRAITGFGCGMAMGPPRLYTTEISLPNMRGLLGAFPNIFLALGITVQAALGSFFSWKKLCFGACIYNILLFFSYFLLCETPYYLLLNDTVHHAKTALGHFREKNYPIKKEMNRLIEFKQENNIRSLSIREKISRLFSHAALKPFGIIMVYVVCGYFSGAPVVTFWTIELLMLTNTTVDPYAGNFYIALSRLIFSVVASFGFFYIARRRMALTSFFGVFCTWMALGIYLIISNDPSIVPLLLLIIYTAFACFGVTILPFLLMTELYPLQIRGTLFGVSVSIVNLVVFLTAKWFPYIRDYCGTTGTFFIFAVFALIGLIFLYFALPETFGLTLHEIEEYYNRRRNTLVSERIVSKVPADEELPSHKREFVEVSPSITSVTSIGSRRSVTLSIDGRTYKSLTTEEQEEITHLQHDMESEEPHQFFDRHHHHGAQHTTHSTQQKKKKETHKEHKSNHKNSSSEFTSTSKGTKKIENPRHHHKERELHSRDLENNNLNVLKSASIDSYSSITEDNKKLYKRDHKDKK